MRRTRIPAEDPEVVKARDQAYIEKHHHVSWAKPGLINGRRSKPRQGFDDTVAGTTPQVRRGRR